MKLKKAMKKLKARLEDFPKMVANDKHLNGRGYRKPGSMNGRKG